VTARDPRLAAADLLRTQANNMVREVNMDGSVARLAMLQKAERRIQRTLDGLALTPGDGIATLTPGDGIATHLTNALKLIRARQDDDRVSLMEAARRTTYRPDGFPVECEPQEGAS
jgi:hypothetical protein